MENKLDPSLDLVQCFKIKQKGRIFLFLFVILIGIFEFSRQNLKITQNCTIAIFCAKIETKVGHNVIF